MRRTVLQEASVVLTVLALAVAATLGHPGVMLGLGSLLLAVGILGYLRTAAQGWLLTAGIGGLAGVGTALAWLLS